MPAESRRRQPRSAYPASHCARTPSGRLPLSREPTPWSGAARRESWLRWTISCAAEGNPEGFRSYGMAERHSALWRCCANGLNARPSVWLLTRRLPVDDSLRLVRRSSVNESRTDPQRVNGRGRRGVSRRAGAGAGGCRFFPVGRVRIRLPRSHVLPPCRLEDGHRACIWSPHEVPLCRGRTEDPWLPPPRPPPDYPIPTRP